DLGRRQALARARAGDAEAVGDAEQRAMRGAQQMLAAAVEEAVGQEIERRAHVRAGVLIGVERAAAPHHQHHSQIGTRAKAEAAATALLYLVGAAEKLPAHA